MCRSLQFLFVVLASSQTGLDDLMLFFILGNHENGRIALVVF